MEAISGIHEPLLAGAVPDAGEVLLSVGTDSLVGVYGSERARSIGEGAQVQWGEEEGRLCHGTDQEEAESKTMGRKKTEGAGAATTGS